MGDCNSHDNSHDCDCGCSTHKFDPVKEKNANKRTVLAIKQLLRGRPDGLKPAQVAKLAMNIKFAPPDAAQKLVRSILDGNDSFEFTDGLWRLIDCEHTSLDVVPFIVVDVETTGGRSAKNRLIEIGAFMVTGGRVTSSIMALINPDRHIPIHISHMTGIYDEHVEHSPRAEEILPKFLRFLADGIFVAHSVHFDFKFINSELARCKLPPMQNEMACTVKLARRAFPGEQAYNLDALIRKFDLQIDPAERHRGHGDAWAAAEILIRCLDRFRQAGVNSLEELLRIQAMPPARAAQLLNIHQ